MWVRWRIYRNYRPKRWHRLVPGERGRTLCGRTFHAYDYLETVDEKKVKAHDCCAHCARSKWPAAG